MITMNFISAFFRVLRDAFLVIWELWVKIYHLIINTLYKYLPQDVARIFLIMVAVIIVGVLVSYFLKSNIK